MMENIFRHLAHDDPAETADPEARRSDKLRRILTAAVEVDKAIFFSVIITIAAFLPLFTMQGVEGQIFGPMSRTYAYALIGAVIATFTVTPVLSSILLPAGWRRSRPILVRRMRRVYESVLPLAVRRYRHARRWSPLAFLLVCGALGTAARHRIPAQARRGQYVDSRGDAADHHARSRHGTGCAHPQRHQELRAGARRCSPSRGAARTAPIRTARSWPSSSCR